MKALLLTPHTTNLRLGDFEEPKITSANEIKAKVLQVGICGTDREETTGGRADAPKEEKELIIGHEMVCQVIETGKEVKNFKKGDYAVVTVRRGCNRCIACQQVRSDMCLTGDYTERGIKGRHGFQCEIVVDEECYFVKVPDSIKDIAVLAEPMSVVQKAIEEAGIIQTSRLPYLKDRDTWLKSKTVLVAGLGPIGLLASLVLKLKGANVLGLDIVDKNSPRAQIIEEIGGTYINDKEVNPTEFTQKHPSIDLILDAAGIAKLDFDLLDFLGINGIFVLTGVPGDQRLLNVDGAKLMRQLVLKNQVMLGSVNESIHHFETGIADLEKAYKLWGDTVKKIISQKVPYSKFDEVFHKHTPNEIKVVIEWSCP